MRNAMAIINSHNKKILSKVVENSPKHGCNCRVQETCPLRGECLTPSIVYKAEVSAEDSKSIYIGMSGGQFKTRFNNHKKSFNLKKYHGETELSKHVWSLKESNRAFQISWSIVRRSKISINSSGYCNLCQAEKLAIIDHSGPNLLNKRSEILASCRHQNKVKTKMKER